MTTRERSTQTDGAASDGDGGDGSTPEALPDGTILRGEVTAVERVPAGEVPGTFPVAIWTDETLAVTLELAYDGSETTTYFSLPETDPDDRLSDLLALHGLSEPDELVGRSLLLEVGDRHCLPLLPDEPQRGDSRAFYGILAGITPSITIALFSFFGLGAAVETWPFLAVFLVCTFLVLPVSLYLDAWHLRTTTGWSGRPLVWALVAIVPPLYVVVVPYYLVTRENAQPFVSAAQSVEAEPEARR